MQTSGGVSLCTPRLNFCISGTYSNFVWSTGEKNTNHVLILVLVAHIRTFCDFDSITEIMF